MYFINLFGEHNFDKNINKKYETEGIRELSQ